MTTPQLLTYSWLLLQLKIDKTAYVFFHCSFLRFVGKLYSWESVHK